MYMNFTVPIPGKDAGVTTKVIKGTTYMYYERERKYDPVKQHTIPMTTTIGKVTEEDPSEMYPNGNFLKYFPQVELPEDLPASSRSGCLKIGAFLVIRRALQYYGLIEKIDRIIGKDSGLFLDLAAYAIVTENNASQYYPDYAYCHLYMIMRSNLPDF